MEELAPYYQVHRNNYTQPWCIVIIITYLRKSVAVKSVI